MDESYIELRIKELAELLTYDFNDIAFLCDAMVSIRVVKEGDGFNRKNYANESMATLGDSFLKFILTEYFYDKGYDKGEITAKKQFIESNEVLFKLSNHIGINKYAYNEKYFYAESPMHDKVSNKKHNQYIEAIIGAIYKDKGIEYCRTWIMSFFNTNGLI